MMRNYNTNKEGGVSLRRPSSRFGRKPHEFRTKRVERFVSMRVAVLSIGTNTGRRAIPDGRSTTYSLLQKEEAISSRISSLSSGKTIGPREMSIRGKVTAQRELEVGFRDSAE